MRPGGTARVLLTRSRADAASLVEGVRRLGLEPVCVPLVERRIRPEAMRGAAHPYAGWVITSAAVVAALGAELPAPQWIAAVGPKTQLALQARGWNVDLVPAVATAESLAQALGDRTGQRVLYPRAAQTSPGTLPALRATGAIVDDIVCYENVEPEGAAEMLVAAWPVEVVTALSGSVIRRLAHHLPPPWPPEVRLVVIGPKTAEEAERCGLRVTAVARPHTAEGVLAAVRGVLGAGG